MIEFVSHYLFCHKGICRMLCEAIGKNTLLCSLIVCGHPDREVLVRVSLSAAELNSDETLMPYSGLFCRRFF